MHHRTWHPDEKVIIRHRLRYDRQTGNLYWRVATPAHAGWYNVGDQAQGTAKDGYIIIGVAKRYYRAHHLAYFLVTGKQVPEGMEVDHINRNPSDNRWINLRVVTRAQNTVNTYIPRSEIMRQNWQDPQYQASRAAAFAKPEVQARRAVAISAGMTEAGVARSHTPEVNKRRAASIQRAWSDPGLRRAQSERLKSYLSDPFNRGERMEQLASVQQLATEIAAKKVRGSIWITDGVVGRRVAADTTIPLGWARGKPDRRKGS